MSTFVWNRDYRSKLFDEIPSGIFVIDRSRHIVDHNKAFSTLFGDSRGKACYSVLKGRSDPCPLCAAQKTFDDGSERILEERGVDREGLPVDYLVQLTPLRHNSSGVDFVAAITTDLTATKRLQREYQTLFEKVPCYVTVINRDLRVVRANERFRETFGEPMGEHCFRLFKKRGEPCPECPVEKTFADGEAQTVRHEGIGLDGKPTHYVAFTAPLTSEEGQSNHVIHMSLDTTEVHELELQLSKADAMRQALLQNSLDAIVVFDEKEKIQIANHAAETLWEYPFGELVGKKARPEMIPARLQKVLAGRKDWDLLHDTKVRTNSGEHVAVRVAAVTLELEGRKIGSAVMAHDLRQLKKLQKEKVDAERLAAVGQTVAGLAHGIKNILTGLEGGMYVTSSGLKKKDEKRTRQGWEMLERNMGRISALAKNLLAFSRGDQPDPKLIRPADVVDEVVSLYRESAGQHGIKLTSEVDRSIETAWLDPEGIHSCLANLVSNAMDACLVSEDRGCAITVRLFEKDATITFEVEDTGCGMDYELKQKAFTSFFTTKGKGGTGIGLLITRKIVQQHGGTVTVLSTPGEGSTFRLSLPRERLPQPDAKEN
jgi:PAS domain S-box-containing protein